jgi:hypothetical protein
MDRLCIVVWDYLVRLWWVALILCVILVDLCLSVLWDCCLIGGSGVIVIALSTTGRILLIVSDPKCNMFRSTNLLRNQT